MRARANDRGLSAFAPSASSSSSWSSWSSWRCYAQTDRRSPPGGGQVRLIASLSQWLAQDDRGSSCAIAGAGAARLRATITGAPFARDNDPRLARLRCVPKPSALDHYPAHLVTRAARLIAKARIDDTSQLGCRPAGPQLGRVARCVPTGLQLVNVLARKTGAAREPNHRSAGAVLARIECAC